MEMSCKMGSLALFLLTLSVLTQHCSAELQCQGKDLENVTETQFQDFKDCLNYHGTESLWKLPPSEYPCFGQCFFKVRGFLTEDGESVLQGKFEAHLKRHINVEQQASIVEGMKNCTEKYGKNLGASKDKTCMKFMQYSQCLHEMVVSACF